MHEDVAIGVCRRCQEYPYFFTIKVNAYAVVDRWGDLESSLW